jgi:hypothetical protein
MRYDPAVLVPNPVTTVALLAVGVAALALRRGISAWWLLSPAAVATAAALLMSPSVSTCDSGRASGNAFAVAVLISLGSCAATSLTAFVAAARQHSARQLLVIPPAAILAVLTFLPVVDTIENCLS